MSETLKPKLRENFANYLDHVVGIGKGIAPPSEGSHHYEAMLELQQLRAKAAAYDEASERKESVMAKMIVSDDRPIRSIVGESINWAGVGHEGVTCIKPYHENGEMAPVVWFMVMKGDCVVTRVNGKYVSSVEYQE